MKKNSLILIAVPALLFCSVILSLSKDALAFNLPDTGQTTCCQDVFPYAAIPCAGTGQDGEWNINPMGYTDNGNGTITDNVTMLMWQKQDDGTKRTWNAAGAYCAGLSLGGQSNWRLPSNKELMTIVDYGRQSPPLINATFFPNTKSSEYWSSSAHATSATDAWLVNFIGGFIDDDDKTENYYVRCVQGNQSSPAFTDNGNGTVTDNTTGLVWQQSEGGAMVVTNALAFCNTLSLGQYSDWRLPNIKELTSIIDYDRYNPSIDTIYFPNAHAAGYWSSTAGAPMTNYEWAAYFDDGGVYGYVNNLGKGNNYFVRCVRGGQSGSNTCDATLSSELRLNIPVLSFSGIYYQVGFQYSHSTDGLIWFTLANLEQTTQSGCGNPATLVFNSGKYVFHIPSLNLSGTSFWLDLEYVPTTDGVVWVKLTNYGTN